VVYTTANNYPLGTVSAFTNSVPSGLEYLLGSAGATGAASGIYGNFVVHGSEIEAFVTRGGTTQSQNVVLTCYPVTVDGTAPYSETTQTLSEQPNAISTLFPGGIAGDQPIKLRSRMRTADMFGMPVKAQPVIVGTFGGTMTGEYNTQPPMMWVWELRFNNADASTTTNVFQVEIRVAYDVEFFLRNGMKSGQPTRFAHRARDPDSGQIRMIPDGVQSELDSATPPVIVEELQSAAAASPALSRELALFRKQLMTGRHPHF